MEHSLEHGAVESIKQIINRTNTAQGSNYGYLKDKQSEVILRSKTEDAIAILPTGYGKTVIFHMLPYVNSVPAGSVLVINPLNAILEEQKRR